MARTGARPGDWKTTPLPALTARLACTRSFSADELRRLKDGLLPEEMEDRWFAVWQDDALWLHRSWTGLCIYRLRFTAVGDRFTVAEALVNRDPQQHTTSDEHALTRLEAVLDHVLGYSSG